MSQTPFRVFAWDDNLLSGVTTLHSCAIDSTADWENIYDWNPGKMAALTDGFIMRETPAAKHNNHFVFRYPTTSTQYIKVVTPGGYTGTYLGTVLTILFGTVPGASVSYSSTTNKWTISGTVAFDLMFNYSDTARRFADALGFAHTDLVGVTSATSDNAVFCEDHLWLVFDIGLAYSQKTTRALMVYAPTITGSQDSIQVYGHASDLGEDWYTWQSQATYQGTAYSAWNSGINDLYVWLPELSKLRYFMISIKAPTTATASSDRRIGVAGFWQDAWFDGRDYDRNFSAPWIPKPIDGDVASRPKAGGAHHVGKQRGEMTYTMPFRGWERTTQQTLRRLYTRYGKTPHLWVMDPDNIEGIWDAAAFAYIEAFDGPKYSGANQYADFDLKIRTVSMNPWE